MSRRASLCDIVVVGMLAGLPNCGGEGGGGDGGETPVTPPGMPGGEPSSGSVPAAPDAPGAQAGAARVVLTWTAPNDGGSPITEYQIMQHPGASLLTVAASPAELTGLTNGETYTFTVAARNALGLGPASSPSSPVVPHDVPNAPSNIMAVAGDRQVALSWTAPSGNGRDVTSYQITSTPDALMMSSATPAVTFTGLRNAINYTFAIKAVNELGASLAGVSTPVMPVLPACAGTVTLTSLGNKAVGQLPVAVAAGRFNADLHADLVVAHYTSNTVQVLLGDGLGDFTVGAPIAVGTSPRALAVGDFNGDASLDVAVAQTGASTVGILLGNGQGGLTLQATALAVESQPYDIAVGDVNGDAKLDLITVNNGAGTASLLLGNGQGGFAAASSLALGNTPVALDIGDINADGKLDFAVAHDGLTNLSLRYGVGDGTFTTAAAAVSVAQRDVKLGDLDGNGRLDLIVSRGSSLLARRLNLINSWGAMVDSNVGQLPLYVELADVDADGDLDVLTSNYTSRSVSVLRNDGTGTLTSLATLSVGAQVRQVLAVDIDHDSDNDIIVVRGETNDIVRYRVGCTQ